MLRSLTFAACALLLMPGGAAVAQQAEWKVPKLAPNLEHVRAQLERFQDPIVAVREGYFSTVGCIEYPQGGGHGSLVFKPGGMGVHFLNLATVGPQLDSLKPQVLIYEPVGDKLRLVAAEWFMPTQAAGATRPTIFGRELEGPMEGHEPIMSPEFHHYDLHVWLWKENPEGVFSSTNPRVKCPRSAYSFREAPPKVVPAHRQH